MDHFKNHDSNKLSLYQPRAIRNATMPFNSNSNCNVYSICKFEWDFLT